MVVYKCDKCEKVFDKKFNYDSHKSRKKPCKTNTNTTPKTHQNDTANLYASDKSAYICKYCTHEFKYQRSLHRHLIDRCKVKKQMNDEREQIFQKLLEKMEMLEKSNDKIQKENKKLRRKMKKIETKKINNNISNCNINNGVINNIKLVAYHRLNHELIDKQELFKSINGFGTPVETTKTIHFNDKHPELHNIYINNYRDKNVMVFDGAEWELRLRDAIIDEIYDTNKEYVEERLEEFVKKLDQSKINALKRWIDADNNDPNGPKINKIKDELKLLLYNKKDMVLKQIAKPDAPMITSIDTF